MFRAITIQTKSILTTQQLIVSTLVRRALIGLLIGLCNACFFFYTSRSGLLTALIHHIIAGILLLITAL